MRLCPVLCAVLLATRFLHENGVLLHFEEQLNGLNQLYFIDCAWLCDLLAEVITVREKHSFIRDGLLHLDKVGFIFSSRRFPRELIPQYLQLLEKFEIAMMLSRKYILVPSMLPKRAPSFTLSQWAIEHLADSAGGPSQPTSQSAAPPPPAATAAASQPSPVAAPAAVAAAPSPASPSPPPPAPASPPAAAAAIPPPAVLSSSDVHYIQRVYCMAYIPSGFWSRLIARLLVGLGQTSLGARDTVFLPSLATWAEQASAAAGVSSSNVSPKSAAKRPARLQDIVLWSSGMCVRASGTCFCVQSLDSTLGEEQRLIPHPHLSPPPPLHLLALAIIVGTIIRSIRNYVMCVTEPTDLSLYLSHDLSCCCCDLL